MLTASTLLSAWESGVSEPPLRQALLLLQAASPDFSAADWAYVPVGERDERLLSLREVLFGRRFEAVIQCPACREPVEASFTADEIRANSAPARTELLEWTEADWKVRFRLPNTADLLSAASVPVNERRALVQRNCIVEAQCGKEQIEPDRLPAAVQAGVVQVMSEADPRAEIQAGLCCAACGHEWSTQFDIVSWLLSEVNEWAERLLSDIVRLARAFGWSESDLLSMSAARRRRYLELLGA